MGFLKRLRIEDGTPVTGGPRSASTQHLPSKQTPAMPTRAPQQSGPVRIENGRKYRLHPTRGWTCIGRAD